MTTSKTIAQTISEIQEALRDYIEAAYHIGHPTLVAQRHSLLEQEGVLFRAPYIESTPRYTTTRSFAELDIPSTAKDLFTALAHPAEGQTRLLYDPPYTHQSEAIEATIRDGMSLVVTTGTGSGKTESFLLPILAKLAIEAQSHRTSFAIPAVRTLILYPMNALVNDQLGRLRLLVGDPRVSAQFTAWSGRPARFARYTSRTLYPGVRTVKKDSTRLKSIETFYIALLAEIADPDSPHHERATALVQSLQQRGKWPAKADLQKWFGKSGDHWKNRAGEFVRAVLRPEDAELLTRHEVLSTPPDILVTNYSMLEYMLMRPLERPVFDSTRQWLAEYPDERLLLVVDEAHLYRGAAGAEVGLLLRRLRARLGMSADRLQVICTSASFRNKDYAREFAAQLVGKRKTDFRTVTGTLALRDEAGSGTETDAEALAAVPLDAFYEANDNDGRQAAIGAFLTYRGVTPGVDASGPALYQALQSFGPMNQLINVTMQEATPLAELGHDVFPTVDPVLADRATTALIALGSAAHRVEGEPGLLPCRIHSFFRGLPGLWACLDRNCPGAPPDSDSPVGPLYSQPRESCPSCRGRVFELYTCRNCGTAYARAYTDDVLEPQFLWSEPGSEFFSVTGHVPELFPIDLLLEEPAEPAEPAELDLSTGRLNPLILGDRMRQVYLRNDRTGASGDGGDDDAGNNGEPSGEFKPCGVCNTTAGYGRSSVQDHQTKGDQPFQALVTRQLEVQPPGAQPYSDFAPLRGRKVLAFSDSRQTAARLAPNLQTYSLRDVLRPVILRGWRELNGQAILSPSLSLDDLYLAVLIGSRMLSVRLRPELKAAESLHVMRDVDEALANGALDDPAELFQLRALGAEPPPHSLLRGIVETLTDRYYGLASLALASLRERRNLEARLLALPPVPGLAASDEERLALARLWISQWTNPGIWFQHMNASWLQTTRGVQPHSGNFAAITRRLPDKEAKKVFDKQWLPALLDTLCESVAPRKYRILANKLALETTGEWGYCQTCRTTQRPFPESSRCSNCRRDRVEVIAPDTDPVFTARKGYYRSSSIRALGDPPERPMAIIAAEHTAQLGAAQADDVFSKAEEHELLFQDVDLGIPEPGAPSRAAIDVLSCTTTMEVGIDIGTLSGVALRNMPPSRASYQQRSGRAGRRGNAVATVIAFGSADSHDEHYFAEPDAMIRGQVDDPVLTLDNDEIARRHVTAYFFQRYHQARLPAIDPEHQPQLFEVLGSVDDFLGTTSPLNRADFEVWLRENEGELTTSVSDWLPSELSAPSRDALLGNLVSDTLTSVDHALGEAVAEEVEASGEEEDEQELIEEQAQTDEERAPTRRVVAKLLDRLLYKGVLPRYAFPTDVVSFHVFDRDRSTRYRPEYQYSPSQGLPIALTQYAPGKEVWIDGKLWKSGALYSPMSDDRYQAWQEKQLYFECHVCHYARTKSYGEAERGDREDCPACGTEDSFGAAKNWIRPPGFAHPQSWEEGTSLDDQPPRSYATRAKLVAPGPANEDSWRQTTTRIREYYERTHLLVTNTGPRSEGYTYCVRCGLIEPTAVPTGTINGSHPKPYPDSREPTCQGSASTKGLVLGTDFISDVLLVSLRVDSPLILRPGYLATEVALRTMADALTIAATNQLEIEPGELQAEYRPALTQGGHEGLEAEIYIYDTLAGGAGFARRIGELGASLFEDAIQLLEGCPANCDNSCYRCLRSFKNRFEHSLLDRHLAASLLRYLVRGEEPVLDKARLEHAADRLFEDLSRQRREGVELQRNALIDLPGIGTIEAPILVRAGSRPLIVGVHGPLTPDHASDEALRDAKEYGSVVPVRLIDEIVISRNLPYASRQVVEAVS